MRPTRISQPERADFVYGIHVNLVSVQWVITFLSMQKAGMSPQYTVSMPPILTAQIYSLLL